MNQQLITLLDLKQKQASVSEAFSAREQARISAGYAQKQADQAEETAKQGSTLILFTVVTIVFVSSIQPTFGGFLITDSTNQTD